MLVALVVSAARPGGPAAASRNSTAGYVRQRLSTAAAETFYGWLRLMNSTAAYRLSSIKGEEKDVGITKKIHDVYSTIKIKDTDPL